MKKNIHTYVSEILFEKIKMEENSGRSNEKKSQTK